MTHLRPDCPAALAPHHQTQRPPADPLLTAPLLPTLLRFALPSMGARLATALAALAETANVGSFGMAALGGMALMFPLVMSAGAMGGGVSSAVSRAFGAGEPARANALAVHAVWIGLTAGSVYMVLMLASGPALFAALGGSGEALTQAVAYAWVAFLDSIIVWLVNTLALGDPRLGQHGRAFGHAAAGGPAAGAGQRCAGPGLGPVVAPGHGGRGRGASGGLRCRRAVLGGLLVLGPRPGAAALARHPAAACAACDILRVGALACLSPLQTVLTILILTRLVAQFGTNALAGYGIGTRLEFLLVPIAFAIGVASVPLVGMAIGAGKVARARRVAWTAAALATAVLGGLGAALAVVP